MSATHTYYKMKVLLNSIVNVPRYNLNMARITVLEGPIKESKNYLCQLYANKVFVPLAFLKPLNEKQQ